MENGAGAKVAMERSALDRWKGDPQGYVAIYAANVPGARLISLERSPSSASKWLRCSNTQVWSRRKR